MNTCYKAFAKVPGEKADIPLGFTDNKNTLLKFYEEQGVKPEYIKFEPVKLPEDYK